MGRHTKLGLIGGLLALAALVPVALADGPAAGVVTPGWINAATMSESRNNATATLLPNGKVVVAGGIRAFFNDPTHATTELYDPVADTWTASGSMAFTRHRHFAVLLQSGKVLVGGGTGAATSGGAAATLNTAELYDPATGAFTPTGNMLNPRDSATAVLLADGRVFVAGGAGATTEIYNPGSGSWSSAASMSVAKTRVGAVLLANGKVLIAGGDNGSPQAGVQLYDPVSNTYATGAAAAPAMSGSRERPTLTRLKDGKVLAAGGTGTGAQSSEIYDPATNTWSPSGGLAVQHGAGAAASLMVDGRVMLSGGVFATDGATSTEVYNPTGGTWSSAGSTLGATRSGHTSIALPTGQVLIAGAYANSGLAAALFTPQTSLSSQSLSFGDQDVGLTRAAAPITVTNTGQTPLLIRGVAVGGADPGDFALATDSCSPAPVMPNATCTLAFTFTPGAPGARSGTVTFRANTGAGMHTGTLSGNGIAVVTLTPTPTPTPTPSPTAVAAVPTAVPTPPPPATKKPQLLATLGFTFKATKKSTKLSSLTVRPTEKGTTITVKCAKGCAKKTFTKTNAGSSVSLLSLVKGKALKVNTTIVITVKKAGFLGTTKTLKIRARKAPSVATKLGVL